MSYESAVRECQHEAALLLPWHVEDALSPLQTAMVEKHLQNCTICAADLERERRVRELIRAHNVLEYTPELGLQKLLARIEEQTNVGETATPDSTPLEKPHRSKRAVWRSPLHWLTAAVVVQAVCLGVLAFEHWQAAPSAMQSGYTTLTSSSPALPAGRGQIRAVFKPEATVAELKSLLDMAGVGLIAGPSNSGIYTLALKNSPDSTVSMNDKLVILRQSPQVIFAEPVSR